MAGTSTEVENSNMTLGRIQLGSMKERSGLHTSHRSMGACFNSEIHTGTKSTDLVANGKTPLSLKGATQREVSW